MAEDQNPLSSINRARALADTLEDQGIFARTPLTSAEILQRRTMLAGLPGLEPTDYTGQLGEASQMARLQLGLALASRGFAAMGAQPRPGEMAISTLGREMLAPLGGDAMAVAQQLYDQKFKLKAAEKAQQAGLTQAALTLRQQEAAQEDIAQDKRLALAKELTERNFTPTKDLQRTVNGKTTDFIGFMYTDKESGVPRFAEAKADGTMEDVPSSELSQYRAPVAGVGPKSTTMEDRVIQVPIRNEIGQITGWEEMTVRQAEQIIQTPEGPDLEFGAKLYPMGSRTPWLVPGPGGTFRNPLERIDYVATDAKNWHKPTTDKLFIKDLSETERAAALEKLGANLDVGEGVNRSTFINKTDPARKKYFFDVKGRSVDITAEEADKWLTVNKPTDIFPAGGRALGTTPKEFTVTDKKTGFPITITAVPWEEKPGIFRWKEIGPDGDYLDEEYQKAFWGTIDEDVEWQRFRPGLDTAFQSAVALRTNLEQDVKDALVKQVLTTTELTRLAPLEEEAQTKALNAIINTRIRNLQKGQVALPDEVLLDPRVKAMTTVPPNAASITRPVVNPRIFLPWTRGGESLQLGTGSHAGFSLPVVQDDIVQGRKNWRAIKRSFEQIYGGAKPLGDAEERVLLFSGLWKNLSGVAEGQKAITMSDQVFRTAFDKAMGLYNDAAKEYKPAAELNIGQGAQAKNLQSSLDDHSDAIRDNVIMLRFKDQGGAWFTSGTWLAELRGTGLGELWESWAGFDGTASAEAYGAMPSDRWADIAKPDRQLNAADLALKNKAFAYLAKKAKNEKDVDITLTEFEKAAEYLGALSRYKIRAFEMIKDSRPSDRDIEILLGAFVGPRDSNSVVFAKLHELQNRHVSGLSRRINQGLSMNAVYDPVFLANLDHTSRALQRGSVRDIDLRVGGRGAETAALFRRSSETIRRAAEAASGRIIPGHRGGVISPFSGNVDEASTANLYRRVLSASREAYPDKDDQAAVAEFVRQGLHLTRYLGVYGTSSQTTWPVVEERDGSFTINP